MKLGTVIDSKFHEALNKLSQQPLPLKTAFKLKGIIKQVQAEYTKYEEVRQAALQKYGLKNEDGTVKLNESNNVQFDDEGMKAFAGELNELMSLDVELPSIKLSELGSGNITVTIADVQLLDGVVVED